ncbi:MAG: tripartite tricarboxylate transporter permease [Pikeienuella sp.]
MTDIFATALPALGEAFSLILAPDALIYLVTGVLLGLCVGVFPGLGGIAGLSLVLPFVYGMDPVSGLSLMVGLIAVIPTSDTFASVLLGIPGSSASQATVLDGFPLARRGQAARALAAAFAASLFGGLVGAVILTFFILVARPLVLSFGVPELLLLTILGFSMVGVLAGRSLLKGLVAVGLGMSIGAIGEAPAQGSPRMDFGSWYLQDGLQLVIVGLAIFAIPEIVQLLRQDRSISEEGRLGAGWWDGVRDWWRNKWLSARCAGLGVIVGVIPGLGGSVVDWLAYGHTMQTTRNRENFGKGEIRGVIGPESSNNAKEGGGLVPTLLFGIPGSGSMAVFIGGLVLLGYEAGPSLIQYELPTTYTIVWSLAIANVVGAGLCIFLAGPIARLTTIRFALLAPFLLMMISFAAFQSKQTLWDLLALATLGLLGIMMKRFDWSRPAFLIGFVLADQAEVYTYQATQIALLKARTGGFDAAMSYLVTPLGAVLILIIGVSVWMGARGAARIHADEPVAEGGGRGAPIGFAVAITVFLAAVFIDAMLVRVLIDKVFPATVGGLALFAALILLWRMRRRPVGDPLFADTERQGHEAPHSLAESFGWLVALLVLTALFGFVIALTLFFVAFLTIRAGCRLKITAILTTGALVFVLTMASALNRDFPPGVLQDLVRLPWPFGDG